MAGITEDIFVGASRTQTSQTLSAIWDEIVASGTNRLVVVQGPPGSGRRAVARALYKHCAIHQEGLPYWPHAFGVGNDTTHKGLSTESLGMLNPSQDNAQMPDVGTAAKVKYLWWALHAIPGKCAAVEAERYLHRHAIPIARAVQTAKDLPMARIRALIEVSCLLSSVVALMDLAIAAPTGVLETEIDWPGVGPGLLGPLKDAPAAGNAFQAALQSRKSVLQKGLEQDAMASLTPGARQEALEAARNSGRLFSLVSEEVPSVIVVDEAEQLDAATAQMLKTIARDSTHQGLMVLLRTTDDAGHPLSALEADVETWWEEDARMGRLTTLALDPLSTDEMIEIALHDLRAADRDQLDKQNLAVVLEASQGRPGFLRHYLTQPAVQEAIIGNSTLTDLRRVPLTKRFDPYTEEAFTALPELAQKQALAALSLLGPATPSTWLATEPADITPSSASPLLTGEKLTAAATTGWTAEDRLSEALRFRSQRAHASAFAHIPAQLTPERQHQVLTAATAHIMAARTTGAWKKIIDPVRESVLAALHSQQNSETGFELEADLEAELMQMKRLTARPAADETTLAALDERLRTGTSSVRLRVSVAQAMLEAGHTERSLAVLREELNRVTAKWGKDVPQTFPALTNLAAAWVIRACRHVGHPEAGPYFNTAIDLYQRLLTARLRHDPPGDERIFRTRSTVAEVLVEVRRYPEAITQLDLCLQEMEEHPGYGPDHLDTLHARSNLANWVGETGNAAAARDLFAALLSDEQRVLGPNHRSTLSARSNLAYWVGDAGDPAAARDLFATLLLDQQRILGPDHPNTFITRNNLASRISDAGDPAAARDLFATLLLDQQRILGPDHPDTLITRNNLANVTAHAGSTATARDLFASLLLDQQRVLGPDHPNTLTTRGNLADLAGLSGDPATARDLYTALLSDRQRVLGPNHPITQATHIGLAGTVRRTVCEGPA
ncbi:tetratricopeptide repeat protein [Kocuria rosea]|uniref:tetratricopeptide repeat protein n=1 Tax=Kocuria rosea TaxID=1275 RepID=UPI002540D92F|nr:tetratricopeptide repeat protein [Kocuria rosea]WIG17597.1 tetratricopeptide repeat protein [Kocuria rosea]